MLRLTIILNTKIAPSNCYVSKRAAIWFVRVFLSSHFLRSFRLVSFPFGYLEKGRCSKPLSLNGWCCWWCVAALQSSSSSLESTTTTTKIYLFSLRHEIKRDEAGIVFFNKKKRRTKRSRNNVDKTFIVGYSNKTRKCSEPREENEIKYNCRL